MLAQSAQRMGYRVEVFAPGTGTSGTGATPAGQVAHREIQAPYDDLEALAAFAQGVDVVTLEFENIPVSALELLDGQVPVRPGPQVLYQTQNRAREKAFLARAGLPHTSSVTVDGPANFETALKTVGTPAVLKTAGFGYDGKGQLLVRGPGERAAALTQLERGPGVLEGFVEFRRELSVIVARSPSGELQSCGPIENRHQNHILDLSKAPTGASPAVAQQSREIAREVAVALDLTGLVCVEFFETAAGELLVNEIAPRPHNSGHLTIEACRASQFEQQLRAVCGLPLANMEFLVPAAMANLLGELWQERSPDWYGMLAHPGVALHLYGKTEPRAGRKMGHLTALAPSATEAVARVERAREALSRTSA